MTHGGRRRVLPVCGALWRDHPSTCCCLSLSSSQRVQAYLPTRGNSSIAVRFFLRRSIFWSHEGTGVPGTSVMEKCPACHPCTSVQMGRVSPPPRLGTARHTFPCSSCSSTVWGCRAWRFLRTTRNIGQQQGNDTQSDRHPREPVPTREGGRGRPHRTQTTSPRQAATRGTILWKVEFDTS
jgi:hypothetical protein